MSTRTEIDQDKLDALLGRVVGDGGAALGAVLAYVGDQLGLWSALDRIGPCASAELAAETDTHERMVREWLAAQAAGGYVDYDASSQRFSLSPEQSAVLADDTSTAFMGGLFQNISEWAQSLDKARLAFRTGKGLSWGDHTREAHVGTERFFRPLYEGNLVDTWIPALDGVEEKLRHGATVADVGCGHGASTVIMAKAYPASTFVGFDFHVPSIQRARKIAAEAGVSQQVSYEVARATEIPRHGFDMVSIFDALHDMDDPAAAAARVREALSPDGTFLLVEPFANDQLEENLNPVGRIFYGASTLVCTPCSLNDEGAALGAQAGGTVLQRLLREAGFGTVRIAAQTPFNLIIEAKP
jgi:2-polyprenyl-3-methyl-5-hydroxy-6-metoxy-1,4-benzoquinol methylase